MLVFPLPKTGCHNLLLVVIMRRTMGRLSGDLNLMGASLIIVRIENLFLSAMEIECNRLSLP